MGPDCTSSVEMCRGRGGEAGGCTKAALAARAALVALPALAAFAALAAAVGALARIRHIGPKQHQGLTFALNHCETYTASNHVSYGWVGLELSSSKLDLNCRSKPKSVRKRTI